MDMMTSASSIAVEGGRAPDQGAGDAGAAPAADAAPRADAAPPGGETLQRRAIKASAWTIFNHGAGAVLRLGSNWFLARLLIPDDFGMSMLVLAFISGLSMFSDIGLGPNIIQSKHGNEPAYYNTAWTVQVIRGFLIWLAACALAYPAAMFYARPQIAYYLPVAAVAAIIYGLSSTSIYTAGRKLDARTMALLGMSQLLVNVVVMGVWAWFHPTVWALIAGYLASQAYRTVYSHFMIPEVRNRFCWDREALASMVGFGRWVFVSTVITFLANQIDSFLLAKLISIRNLGLYGQAMRVASTPRDVSTGLLGAVLFPVLAERAREGRERMKETLRKARRVVLPMAMMAILGVALLAPPFFEYLYRPEYHDAGWVAQLLCVQVWFITLQMSVDRALLALGDSKVIAGSTLVRLVVSVCGCLVGHASHGFPGFIVGYSTGYVAGYVVVVIAMWHERIAVVEQDLKYTLSLAALAVAGTVLPPALHRLAPVGPDAVWAFGVALLILGGTGAWAAYRFRHDLRALRRGMAAGRKGPDAAATATAGENGLAGEGGVPAA